MTVVFRVFVLDDFKNQLCLVSQMVSDLNAWILKKKCFVLMAQIFAVLDF